KSRIDRPLFRLPMVNQITSGGAAVVLGIARAAIDEIVTLSLTKTGMDGAPLAHQPHIQSAIGRAVAQVNAARGLLLSTLGGLDAAATENRASSEAERGAVRSALSYAGEIGRAVITAMYELSSSTGVYESSRLSKLFRDGHVAAQHATLAPAYYALAGRTVIGLPANDPSL
ncbi:hypothetical protein NGM37_20245, partial [Streptomyces sp. TRM76130]|nr:hypothetical protein [Streptomyces sp. TRM76130]